MIVEEAREMRWHGKSELVTDRRKALRSVGDSGNRALQPLHVEENTRCHPHRRFEQPEEMRPREADVGGEQIEIADLARCRLDAIDSLADAEIDPVVRGNITDRIRHRTPVGEALKAI